MFRKEGDVLIWKYICPLLVKLLNNGSIGLFNSQSVIVESMKVEDKRDQNHMEEDYLLKKTIETKLKKQINVNSDGSWLLLFKIWIELSLRSWFVFISNCDNDEKIY